MAEGVKLGRLRPKTRVSLSFEEIAAAVTMALLAVLTFANVVVRYLTNYSLAFTEEYSIVLMVIVALLGTAIAAAGDTHIRVTWLMDQLPPKLRKVADMAGTIALIGMFGMVAWFGALLVWDEYTYGVTSPALGWPQWIYTAVLPVLSLVVMLRALGHLLRIARRAADSPSQPQDRDA